MKRPTCRWCWTKAALSKKLSLISEDGVKVETEPLRRETSDVGSRLSQALEDANQRCVELDELLSTEREQVTALQEQLRTKEAAPSEEVSKLQSEFKAERES